MIYTCLYCWELFWQGGHLCAHTGSREQDSVKGRMAKHNLAQATQQTQYVAGDAAEGSDGVSSTAPT